MGMHYFGFLKVTIHFHQDYKQGICAAVEGAAVLLPHHVHSGAYHICQSGTLFLTAGTNLAIFSMILVL